MRERNRLAANLHDTLPQSMDGIGLQLDVCEFTLRRLGIKELPPLQVVRRMVDYAMTELRNAVWEMRSLSLRGRDFTAALHAVVEQAKSGYATTINVSASGDLARVSEFVSGTLLLILQEALRNAQQHGKARNIQVKIAVDGADSPIPMEVNDDGCGFPAGPPPGPEQGHYGVVGMRERARTCEWR